MEGNGRLGRYRAFVVSPDVLCPRQDNAWHQYSWPAKRLLSGGVQARDDGRKEVTEALGTPPRTGWAHMVVELHVNNLEASLSFWRGVLGFETAFARSEERFAYLEHPEGHQIMLCQRHGRFETGPLDSPLGQGVMGAQLAAANS
jgi:hypothetical protein